MPITFKTLARGGIAAGFIAFAAGLQAAPPAPDEPSTVPALAVTELSFDDFYRMPVGPLGLEPTPRLLGLAGQRVRLRGFMVREEEPLPGRFLLTPLPVALSERADGPVDDLPAATVFVHLPSDAAQSLSDYVPGPLVLEGRLELGAFDEADERKSWVRLRLDDTSIRRPRPAAVAADARP
jgi:hypothetical protein